MENEEIKIYTEIGFGNSTFINTEKEYPDGHEERVPGFIKMDFEGVYLRIWFGTRVIIISTKNGFKTQIKNRSDFKALIGIQGHCI
tara:strand:+ start:493 stop:750 length:258 start_codon:yes stop_codon:yes gene_type:complete